MHKPDYSKGLHKLVEGVYAYLQPRGQWGLSNAGLITDGGQSLLVDTLFDLRSTREMLDSMRKAEPAATKRIGTLVITHANGDHFYGSELVKGAEVICTATCAEEMAEAPPQMMEALMKQAPALGSFGQFLIDCFGAFEFKETNPLPATRTFVGRMELRVGDKQIQLIEVGPAHTRGDLIVYLPDDKLVFAADVLFIKSTPIMWAGPVKNCIAACDLMLDLDVEVVVPGHGPITDKQGVRSVKNYWEFIERESRECFHAGLTAEQAAAHIDLRDYATWGESERTVVNVKRLYSSFKGDDSPANIADLFVSMAAFANIKQRDKRLLEPG
ncbi:MAG: MBL fold metallo-hydrolase [Deltaproteobacteria bacterium]|nr:MBL fold metallo-hydrolase [Deltaproteobacteria bacterium]